MTGIYRITSPSGKVYIGQSRDIAKRFSHYINLYSSVKRQTRLYNSLVKYSPKSHKFEILVLMAEDINQEKLNLLERTCAVEETMNGRELMNIREPGSNGKLSRETINKLILSRTGKKRTEEQRRRMSLSHIGKESHRKGKRHPEETRSKMRKVRVCQFDLDGNFIREWESCGMAGEHYGVCMTCIHNCAKGRSKTSCGFKWKFIK